MTAPTDVQKLLDLVDTFHGSGLATLELQVGSMRLSIRAEDHAAEVDGRGPRPAGAGTPGAAPSAASVPAREDPSVIVTAPVLGIVAAVDNGPVAAEGSRVSAGQVVAVLEVRGRRVDVPSPVPGTIARVVLAAGALAEYGAPLLEIDLDGVDGSGSGR